MISLTLVAVFPIAAFAAHLPLSAIGLAFTCGLAGLAAGMVMILRFLQRRRARRFVAGLDVPAGGFRTILADPPWRFLTWSRRITLPTRAALDPYPTMTLEQMKALPIGEVAAKDCALFMWVIDTHVDQAIALAARWGFKYQTRAFVWIKTSKRTGKPIMGMGHWTRKESEEVLLFTRGSPKRLSRGVRQLIFAPRREHSRKPDEQYALIEQLVGGPRLELFSRTNRVGWTSWGRDVGKFGEAA